MAALPSPLVRRLAPPDAEAVRGWWAGLTDADQRDLLARRANRCDHARDGVDGDWHRLPVRVGVRFLPADPPGPGDDWRADYLEHLLNDPAVTLYDIPWVPVIGVCTAHPAARGALAAGVIPADFACPLGAEACPMRRLLAECPGRHARLTLLPAPEVADVRQERLS
ncbi:MAG: hypothetical protein K2X82_32810 [Gemmataceae bacterium]|nr:hypothetical protein [Gemmataceae bacterium]